MYWNKELEEGLSYCTYVNTNVFYGSEIIKQLICMLVPQFACDRQTFKIWVQNTWVTTESTVITDRTGMAAYVSILYLIYQVSSSLPSQVQDWPETETFRSTVSEGELSRPSSAMWFIWDCQTLWLSTAGYPTTWTTEHLREVTGILSISLYATQVETSRIFASLCFSPGNGPLLSTYLSHLLFLLMKNQQFWGIIDWLLHGPKASSKYIWGFCVAACLGSSLGQHTMSMVAWWFFRTLAGYIW